MKYAVLDILGHQYKVNEGDTFVVDKTDELPEIKVLMTVDGDKVEIGTPALTKKVKVEVVEEVKGDKINGFKYKAKSRYRKSFGFRGKYTKLHLVSL